MYLQLEVTGGTVRQLERLSGRDILSVVCYIQRIEKLVKHADQLALSSTSGLPVSCSAFETGSLST